jgi:type IV pilus assembly protein PilA
MLTTLRTRLHDDEDGFTLIELMVVVLIIAILIAIAIPTFLGVQDRAKDRSAQSDLRNGLTAAKTLATDNAGKFLNSAGTVIVGADLHAVEPSLTFVDADASDKNVQVTTGTGGSDITLVRESDSGDFFCISSDVDGAVKYGKGATAAAISTRATCNADKW